MRKHIFGKQLQRDVNERKALFKSLMSELIIHESIKTTQAKALAVRAQFEKLVTKARSNNVHSQQHISRYFSVPIAKKLIAEIAPRFVNRPGGYTRIIKLGNRFNDDAKMVMLELVEKSKQVVLADATVVAEPKTTEIVDAEIVTKAPAIAKATAGKAKKPTAQKTTVTKKSAPKKSVAKAKKPSSAKATAGEAGKIKKTAKKAAK